jgi:hypothetical protein
MNAVILSDKSDHIVNITLTSDVTVNNGVISGS